MANSMGNWPERFEDILSSYLSDQYRSEALDSDIPLATLGIDSMAVVGLMIELETEFEFSFPEEFVNPQTFYTPGSLWSVVSRYASTGPDRSESEWPFHDHL
ncbi:phosphopantetheine-binding protein [Micromonospora sp. NPDC005652]|uniref:phosphopantetheine-binding protein n=1 Tax=Micromonospora sp. NPDC005652 TaxID=3157046 RepID=UPI0033FD8540